MIPWRENPPSPERGYSGMTWLKLNGKEYACVGIGPDVRAAMMELAERGERK